MSELLSVMSKGRTNIQELDDSASLRRRVDD